LIENMDAFHQVIRKHSKSYMLNGRRKRINIFGEFCENGPFFCFQGSFSQNSPDAFDTLYIGCEKFPQHDVYPIALGGIM